MLRTCETGKYQNKTVTSLNIIQRTQITWTEEVQSYYVQKYRWKSTLLSQSLDQKTGEDKTRADRENLQRKIDDLPGILTKAL